MRRTRTRTPKREPSEANQETATALASAPVRRDEILAIAARHFAEHGFESTTIRQISDEAGILSGSLYYHFSNKEEILHGIMRPFVNGMIDRYRKIAETREPSDILISRLLRFALNQVKEHHIEHEITFNDRKFFRRTPQFNYIIALGVEVSHVWYGAIQQGVREGVFRSDVNVRLTTTMILKMINATADWYDPQGHDSLEAMIETQEGLILGGLRAAPPSGPA